MKLSRTDILFIRHLLNDEKSISVVVSKLESQSDAMPQQPTGYLRNTLRSIAAYVLLCVEVIAAMIFPGSLRMPGTVFFDHSPGSMELRYDFLRYFAKDKSFVAVTVTDRTIGRYAIGNKLISLFVLGLFLLKSAIFPTDLSPFFVRSLRRCWLVHGHVLASGMNEVYIFQIHRVENTLLAAYLHERGVCVKLVASTTPLAAENRYLIGDSVILCNPYQQYEFAVFKELGLCRDSELWGPEEISILAPNYEQKVLSSGSSILGLYTQGMHLRWQLGRLGPVAGPKLIRQEEELIRLVIRYLRDWPGTKLIVYPHPIERRRYLESSEYQHKYLQEIEGLSIDFSGKSSILRFDEVGLGITTVSTVGFDRIFLGFRTVFFTPNETFIDPSVRSPYDPIFCRTADQLFDRINELQKLSDEAFMSTYFGRRSFLERKNG